MPFQFKEIDGIDSETIAKLNANSALIDEIDTYASGTVEESVNNRLSVIKADFKTKMDALDAKKRAAEEALANGGMDPDELKALREARDKNPELQATLDALKAKSEARDAELAATQGKMQAMRLGVTVNEAINAYNTANPTRLLKSDASDLVTLLARDSLKYDADSDAFKVYDKNGDPMATDKGAATPVDWLVNVRNERPSLFDAPTGGGAPGSSNPGGADKSISRGEFAKLPPMEQAKVVRTHQITE